MDVLLLNNETGTTEMMEFSILFLARKIAELGLALVEKNIVSKMTLE